MHVEIAGAGFAGLAAGTVLGQAGWSVRIHERAPEVREIGAGIFMILNGWTALEAMGLGDRLKEDGAQVLRREMMTGKGRLLQSLDIADSRPWVFPRQHLVQVLREGALNAGAELITDSRVESANPDGTLSLADGTVQTADLVIGADGYRSVVRESLGLALPTPDLGTTSVRFLIEHREPAIPNTTRQYWERSRRLQVSPCGQEGTYVYLACRHTDVAARQEDGWLDDWLRTMPAAAHALEHLRDRTPHVGRYPQVFTSSWVNGRAAIVGDAAHAMAPSLGQGANLAIVNSLVLSQRLRGSNRDEIPGLLVEWESQRRPITIHTQTWSRRYNFVSSRWPQNLAPMRNLVVRGFGKMEALDRRMRAADLDLAVH